MYPGQLLTNPSASAEVARQCRYVIQMSQSTFESGQWGIPAFVFAVFLAGVASPELEVKSAAIWYIEKFESMAIGQNASRTRHLLTTICEEQRQRVVQGGHAAEVDWLSVAKSRGLEVMTFGL